MVQKTSLEYLSMPKPARAWYRVYSTVLNLPFMILGFFKKIPKRLAALGRKIAGFFMGFVDALHYGNLATRLTLPFWGVGSFAHRQFGRGLLYQIYEIVFIAYLAGFGVPYLSKLGTLGTVRQVRDELGFIVVQGDNSFNILLYSMLTFAIIFFSVVIMIKAVKDAYENQLGVAIAERAPTLRDDVSQLLNKKFHFTILALPSITLAIFTIVPLMFMILVAFTNYNRNTLPPANLFTWVGFDNFASILTGKALGGTAQDAGRWSYTFWHILGWTLIWAVIATFSCLFAGMLVAMLINKKSIKLKKFWRICLITVVAVPQFISLLLVSKMLRDEGIINTILRFFGTEPVRWLNGSTMMAKIVIIVVNLWVGVPFTVLSCTGILMNIPEDLYEAARIDGANPFRMFTKITFPYMMFVLGPSMINSFVGNINNFNIIFLLTGGQSGTTDMNLVSSAGDLDLLITWLYKLTVDNSQYDMASVIGIMVFIVVAFFSLIVYSRIGSVKNEEEFQ